MLVSMCLTCAVSLLVDCLLFFFFNDTATTEIYTLSLHDALPISGSSSTACVYSRCASASRPCERASAARRTRSAASARLDRKSTRLNSSHANISYAVFCLKKKKKNLNAIHYNLLIDDSHFSNLCT